MLISAAKKVAWMARTTTTVVGLAIMLALVFGVATTALAGTGIGATLNLGKTNTVNAVSKLVGSVAGPSLQVDNNSTGAGATALDLQVEAGKAPMTVNSAAKVASLNADRLDGKDSGEFATGSNGVATDADKVDGLDANGLSRAAFSQSAGTVVNGQDGTMRSVDIIAPTEGFLVISASASGQNTSASDIASCGIQVDDSPISGSTKFIQLNGAQNVNEIEACATDAVRPVLAGSHRVEFEAADIDSSGTTFFNPSLWVIFVPFDGSGEQPVFSE
jgi:hypothetical protein